MSLELLLNWVCVISHSNNNTIIVWKIGITRDTVARPDSISKKDLMEKTSDNNMVKQLLFATRPGHVQPVGRPCGTWMWHLDV